ncbi:MAG: homoserine O-acetyltransferase [candidate division Zixibacteria bacterium]|nr:homoserine O-acetyltransferase [candidate division Zixibacteria bacterium]
MSFHSYLSEEPFALECGEKLECLELAYHTYGTINSARDNIVWICHALTANSDPVEWWPGLAGSGKLFDPSEYFIICVNMLGSCYGSSGPLSINADTGRPYYRTFPQVTVRDMARSMIELRQNLQIEKIHIAIGGSMGGQQVLEWAVMEPGIIEHIIPIATNVRHSPWGKAFNEAQRMAIEADATWKEDSPEAGKSGLKAARAIGMLSYRTYEAFLKTQADEIDGSGQFKAVSYQQYQGEKLAKRFTAQSYWLLSHAMDNHNLGRERGKITDVLKTITSHTLVISVTSDNLFPVSEQEFIASHISGAIHRTIDSEFGHDGFLIEFNQLREIIKEYLHHAG